MLQSKMFRTRIRLSLIFHLFSITYLSAEAQLISSFSPALSPFQRTRFSTAPSRGLQFKHREVLNAATGTVLEWEVDPQRTENSTITFKFSTNAENLNSNGNTGILLGLSRTGHVAGADVVAVTVNNPSGQLVDMHAVDNATIAPDTRQNWRLVSTQRNSSQVSITVSRILNTCDEQDVSINTDLIRIIWGFTNQTISENAPLNFVPEGIVREYLLDPTVERPATTQTWRMSRKFQIPARRTSYWCSIHRGLQFPRKHHIVGYAPYFRDEIAKRHVHHQLIYRCLAPPDVNAAQIFDKYVNHPGEECFIEDNHQLPSVFCMEIIMSWGVGGNEVYLPNNIGFPIGEARNEYYMFETHYDNPESRSDLVIENGIDFFYSSQLRPTEGSMIFASYGILGLFHVPPRTSEFTVAGHCSSDCTQSMVPAGGMEIVGTLLHTHLTGKKMTLKKFRGNRELPWIQSEGNYDFAFQQMRLLSEPNIVLPGDHITVECLYDTSGRNGTTASGFSTTDEMCMGTMIVNKRLPYTYCSSEYPTDRTMARYGITNMTWNENSHERVVNAANNRQLVGHTFSRAVDQSVGTWTPQRVRELEREMLYYPTLDSTCPLFRDVLLLAHALNYIDDVTGGLIPTGNIVDNLRPTTDSIRTPIIPGLKYTRYPTVSSIYTPPLSSTCPA